MCNDIKQHRDRTENIIIGIKHFQNQHKLNYCEKHGTNQQISIGSIGFDDVITETQTTKKDHEHPLNNKQEKPISQFVIRKIGDKKINEKKTVEHL